MEQPIAADFVEDLVNTLHMRGTGRPRGVSSGELSMVMSAPKTKVRSMLKELEKLGIVFRTGATRGTRWFLG